MSLKMLGLAAAAVLVSAGLATATQAADVLDQAPPLDLSALSDIQTGLGASGPGSGLPDPDEMFAGVDEGMEEANGRVAEGIEAASQAVALQGGNQDAEAMLYALPYVYSAIPVAVGAAHQGVGTALGSLDAMGGALDLAPLQNAGAGL